MLIETKHGHKVEIKDELSARDHLFMKQYVGRKMTLRSEGGKNIPEIKGEAIADLEVEGIKRYLVGFNGSVENAYDRMLDTLTASELDQVLEHTNKKKEEEGKE